MLSCTPTNKPFPLPPSQLGREQPAGDHDAVICRVIGVAGPAKVGEARDSHGAAMLYTRYLRELGVI